jgi:esterase/lipase superfamily enzyme
MGGAPTAALLLILLAGCASTASGPYRAELMPAPDIYATGGLDPFAGKTLGASMGSSPVLYATDRQPSESADAANPYYLNERGHVLRLGVAKVRLGEEPLSWEEVREVTLRKERDQDYPLSVVDLDEWGVLDRSQSPITLAEIGDVGSGARAQFVESIDARLERSGRKDIYIYVHGYKVVFENPLTVAAELWHYLGYEGAMVAFAWPSTPSRWAYFADLETTDVSARHLRLFLRFLSQETAAERIHIVGYSAGTRVVVKALHQLALQAGPSSERHATRASARIGHVILVGSDIDRQVFGSMLSDGLLDQVDRLSIYLSQKDDALGISRWVFGRDRLGQDWLDGEMLPSVSAWLQETDELAFINVTAAEGSSTGNGHGYFRRSPWASSDILTTLLLDLSPGERGLVRAPGTPIWAFPPDYVERLRAGIEAAGP